MKCSDCDKEAMYTDSVIDLDNCTQHNLAYKREGLCYQHMLDCLMYSRSASRILPLTECAESLLPEDYGHAELIPRNQRKQGG